MKYKLIIFDFDGTLADTSLGIINSHKHANAAMGRPIPNNDTLASVIGGPLLDTYHTMFGFSDEDAAEAVRIYRERYAKHGVNELVIYDGMAEALSKLKARGFMLAVATLKAEKFAIPMLEMLGIAKYFDVIHGVDDKDTRTKASLIGLCMDELNVTQKEAVLVGDSIHDAKGAATAGVDFIAALYGFGFRTTKDTAEHNCIGTIKLPVELLDLLCAE